MLPMYDRRIRKLGDRTCYLQKKPGRIVLREGRIDGVVFIDQTIAYQLGTDEVIDEDVFDSQEEALSTVMECYRLQT